MAKEFNVTCQHVQLTRWIKDVEKIYDSWIKHKRRVAVITDSAALVNMAGKKLYSIASMHPHVFDHDVTTALRPIAFRNHYFLCVHVKGVPVVRVFDSIKTYYTADRNKLILKLCTGANAVEDMECVQQPAGSNDCGFHTAWNLALVLGVKLEPGRKALCDAMRARVLEQQEMFADVIIS
jgi:hypothetical protein